MSDNIKGYEITRSIVFENDRGFALGENPQAVQPFVTWQFTEDENGARDFYWGHYTSDSATATRDYETRVSEYQYENGVSEKSAYQYYSTQRPVDIGTFPKTPNGPLRLVNFDSREDIEQGKFKAWGYLVYDAPLSEKQISDYELKAAPSNPDIKDRMREQAQIIGPWEEKRKAPEHLRLTIWLSEQGAFAVKKGISPEDVAERYRFITERAPRDTQKKSIAEQLKDGAEQVANDNAARPAPVKKTDRDR